MSSVDVVVPCYRYGHFLRECVESILAQSGVQVRVLVIDDASPDNTAQVAAQLAGEDSRVTFLRHRLNKGHIATYNEGIEWASSDYFLLLSADDYLLPGSLARASELMKGHPEVGFSFGNVLELSNEGATKEAGAVSRLLNGDDHRILRGVEFLRVSGARNIVPTPTAVVRTSLQKAVGGYNQELPHTGDMEMWFRLAAHASVGVVGQLQAVYRRHANNMSHAYFADHWLPDLQQRKAAIVNFFETCGHLLPDAQSLRRKVLRALACDAASWASAAFNDGDLGLCNELAEFATTSCPSVRRSLAWAKLGVKRRVGVRRWRTMQPAIAGLQRLVGSTKG